MNMFAADICSTIIGAFARLLLMSIVCAHQPHTDFEEDFVGSHHWQDSYRYRCSNPPMTIHSDLYCYMKYVHYEAIRIEILNRSPLLIHIHRLITDEHATKFIALVDNITSEQLMVVSDESVVKSVMSDSRRANGTWFEHEAIPIFGQLFQRLQHILLFDLHASEQWQVLSYEPGGHYAPHYDYLQRANANEFDYWMSTYGNRLATFLLILETASKGGGTIFPNIDIVVMPNVGDAIIWTNMNTDGSMDDMSLHGACPIEAGRKVAATLWIREWGQEFRLRCPTDRHLPFPIDSFIA